MDIIICKLNDHQTYMIFHLNLKFSNCTKFYRSLGCCLEALYGAIESIPLDHLKTTAKELTHGTQYRTSRKLIEKHSSIVRVNFFR